MTPETIKAEADHYVTCVRRGFLRDAKDTRLRMERDASNAELKAFGTLVDKALQAHYQWTKPE